MANDVHPSCSMSTALLQQAVQIPACMSVSTVGIMTVAKEHAVYELLELKSIKLLQTCVVLTLCHRDLSCKPSCSACFTYASML